MQTLKSNSIFIRLIMLLIIILFLSSCDILKPDPEDNGPNPENVGKLKWSFVFGDTLYSAGDPAIASDGTIYISASGGQIYWTAARIYAINPDSTLKWRSDELDLAGISSNICIGPDGTIYVIGYYTLYAINPSDGSFNWTWKVSADGNNLYQIANLVIGNDGTLFLSHVGAGSYVRRMFAITPQGQTKWITDHNDGQYATNITIGTNGYIYAYWPYTNTGKYYIVKIDPQNGAEVWRSEIPDGSSMMGGSGMAVSGSGDLIVSVSHPEYLLKISSSNGNILWRKTIAKEGMPSIAPNGDILMFAFNQGLFCYNSSGELRWNINNGVSGTHKIAIDSEGKIYVNGSDFAQKGNFQCFNSDGSLNWAIYLNMGDNYCPAIANDGTIYIRCSDGLMAVQGDKPLASGPWARTNCSNTNSRNPNQ